MIAAKKKILGKKKVLQKPIRADKEPDYMVQVNEPRTLRKDALESLRDIIVFMQGYEKFRKIQEEKVALFSTLKADVRELNSLVEGQLRKYFPKGKLHVSHAVLQDGKDEKTEGVEILPLEKPARATPKPVYEEKPRYEEEKVSRNELDELEEQLKYIEDQLRNIK